MDVFDRILEKLGSQAALAELCDVTPQAVWKWKEARIPADKCRTIAEATGIAPGEMRPDIFGPVCAEARP